MKLYKVTFDYTEDGHLYLRAEDESAAVAIARLELKAIKEVRNIVAEEVPEEKQEPVQKGSLN